MMVILSVQAEAATGTGASIRKVEADSVIECASNICCIHILFLFRVGPRLHIREVKMQERTEKALHRESENLGYRKKGNSELWK